jgi:hypothetical protein
VRQPVLNTVDEDGDIKGGVQDRANALAVRAAALAGNDDVVGLLIELGLVCIGKMLGNQYGLHGFAKSEYDGRVRACRRRLAFAFRLGGADLDPSSDQLPATLEEIQDLGDLDSL